MNEYTTIDGKRINRLPNYVQDDEMSFSPNSLTVLQKRYVRRDENGEALETVAGMFYRVARVVAMARKEDSPLLVDEHTETFYRLMTDRDFFPNSPTFTGAGTRLGQLAACFVLPLTDDMGKEDGGIFDTLKNAALIQQTGGGNGFSFSRLRPKGDIVTSSGGEATGPVGFLQVYDQAFGVIAQGGSRRGASMAVLRCDHPDVEEFITCKAEEGKIANFNISVALTDEFMQAVESSGSFDLRNPRDGKVWRTVQARDLFDKIVKYAHRNGEPGALFIDAANRGNPVPHLYELEATNPCVTGDTLIYTKHGLITAEELCDSQQLSNATLDGRFPEVPLFSHVSSPVIMTGLKHVYRLVTKEGYEVKATADHLIMTEPQEGWLKSLGAWTELKDLRKGDKIRVLNRKGGFGVEGNIALGRVIGWICGDGTLNTGEGAGLMFWGEEQELAPMFAEYVNDVVGVYAHENTYVPTRAYEVSPIQISDRDETRVSSQRLRKRLAEVDFTEKGRVPRVVFAGCEDMQRGFLQALFSADGTVLNNVDKGVRVRLASSDLPLLIDTQRLLLNFGIFSKIYQNRRPAGEKLLPDGKGGQKLYATKAQHELAISKQSLLIFAKEIGFLQEAKTNKLQDALDSYGGRGPYAESFTATVEAIEPVGAEMVYDLCEPLTHSFVANGIVVHNCGEQWLGPYENCCLGSINLSNFVKDGKVNWSRLALVTSQATRFLDCVIDANAYVPAVPELREAALKARRIGLGIMGLADAMYKMGIRYGSSKGEQFAAQIMEFVRYWAMTESIRLARDYGDFPAIKGSIYDFSQTYHFQPPTSVVPYTHDFLRPNLDWVTLMDLIAQHGIRNAAQTTIAPTGTIATVVGCEGYGCEPVFALGYIRHFKDGDKDVELAYTSPLFDEALRQSELPENEQEQIRAYVSEVGSCQDLKLPESIHNTFVVSGDITAEEHVRMQAALQAFVDNSLSKTINFPQGATVEDVAEAYQLAWRLGCKGLTVYVTGSREQVVLETKATQQKKSETPDPTPATKAPRPHVINGATYRKETPIGTAYVTVNGNEGDPCEVFLNVGKAGSEVSAVSEAMGRLMSLVLRLPSLASRAERLAWIADELEGIGGGRPLGFGAKRVRSLPDGLAQVLWEHLGALEPEEEPVREGRKTNGDICPECGEASFLNVEGCRKCRDCGYSEC